jgi:hypothetical protein
VGEAKGEPKAVTADDTKVVDVDEMAQAKVEVKDEAKVDAKDSTKDDVKASVDAMPALPRTSTVTSQAPIAAEAEPRSKRPTAEPATTGEGRTKRPTVEPEITGRSKRPTVEPGKRNTPDPEAMHSHAKNATVDPDQGSDARSAADMIALPRTMSEEWMAADADDGAYDEGPRRPRWIIPAIVGGIAAIGLVVALTVGGNDSNDANRTVAARSIDGSGQGSSMAEQPPVAPTAPVVPAVAASDAAVALQPADAADVVVTAIDAAPVAVTPPDAAAVAVVVPDAAVPAPVAVAVAPTGSASATAKPVEAKPAVVEPKPPVEVKPKPVEVKPKPAEIKPKPEKPAPPPKDERTIEQLVDAGEFAKANSACATNTQFSEPRLVACATAACQTHNQALATRWIRAIPKASREAMIQKCKAAGTDVQLP